MIIVKIENGENIERSLKKFKRKVDKTKMIKELRDRQTFEKPSVRKRRMIQKAKYVSDKFSDNNE